MSLLKPTQPSLWSLLATLALLMAYVVMFFAGQSRAAFWLMGLCGLGLFGVWLPRYLWARWRFGRPLLPFEIRRGAAWKRCVAVTGDIEPVCQTMGKKRALSSLYWFVVSNDDGSWEYAIETSGQVIQGICCNFKSSQHAALNFDWSVSRDDFIACNGDGCWSRTALMALEQAGRPSAHVMPVSAECHAARGRSSPTTRK